MHYHLTYDSSDVCYTSGSDAMHYLGLLLYAQKSGVIVKNASELLNGEERSRLFCP